MADRKPLPRPATAPGPSPEIQRERLEGLSAKLNASADAMRTQLAEVEQRVRDLRLGVGVWVPGLGVDEEEGVGEVGFAKLGKKWLLLWRVGSVEPTPIVASGSRRVCCIAVDTLPTLIEAMIAQAEKLVAEVTETTDKVYGMLDTINSGNRK